MVSSGNGFFSVCFILICLAAHIRMCQPSLVAETAQVRVGVTFPKMPSSDDVTFLRGCSLGDKALAGLADSTGIQSLATHFGWTLGYARGIAEEIGECGRLEQFDYFPMVTFITSSNDTSTIVREMPEVRVFPIGWEGRELCHSAYIRLLMGIELAIKRGDIDILNISAGPPPWKYDEYEPMNVATEIAAEHGIVVVVAAGNGGPEPGTLNPWSVAPWVIGVGATSSDGKKLWLRSSRGLPEDSMQSPDVVAPGEEIELLAPPDYQELRSYSGTSFAASHVSGIASYILQFLRELALQLQRAGCGVTEVGPLDVKSVILDMARPMNAQRYEVGAGFVRVEMLESYLSRFDMQACMRTLPHHHLDSSCVNRALRSTASGSRPHKQPVVMVLDTDPMDPEHPISVLLKGPIAVADSFQYRRIVVFHTQNDSTWTRRKK